MNAPDGDVHIEVRSGVYRDSVTLMQISRDLATLPGVAAAQVAMATPLNLEVLSAMHLPAPTGTGPNDLVVALRLAPGRDQQGAHEQALAHLARLLAAPVGTGVDTEQPPRTTASALRHAPAALVVVSVPGESALAEAMDAVLAGSSVVIFSDNVPVEQEIALKDAAAARDVLVMGPDCGTVVVDGVGIGFANAVRPGPVSLVAASGTGAQHLMSLLDAGEVGIRHCLGVGGRDLTAAVAGRSARTALAALAADPGTELVVVVSKPPAAEVAQVLRADAARLGVRVVWALLGEGQPDLTSAAEQVLATLGLPTPGWPSWSPPEVDQRPGSRQGPVLRGLFVGGTLCEESMLIASDALGEVRSNIPLRPEWLLVVDGSASWDAGSSHAMVDFGDDQLTVGRPHPMIDPSLREQRLVREGADPRVGVLLVDVVLGYGSHPDPATGLADAIDRAIHTAANDGRHLAVVVSLTGTNGDPQGRDGQAQTLAAAGAHVHLSNAQATRHALSLLTAGGAR